MFIGGPGNLGRAEKGLFYLRFSIHQSKRPSTYPTKFSATKGPKVAIHSREDFW
jgi:hypothetical protein